MPTHFPLPKGVFSGGEGVLFFVRIPSALVMGGIGHELSRGARHFLCAQHMNQVCGFGRIYMNINEHRCDKTCLQGFADKIIPKPAFSATETIDRIVKSRLEQVLI